VRGAVNPQLKRATSEQPRTSRVASMSLACGHRCRCRNPLDTRSTTRDGSRRTPLSQRRPTGITSNASSCNAPLVRLKARSHQRPYVGHRTASTLRRRREYTGGCLNVCAWLHQSTRHWSGVYLHYTRDDDLNGISLWPLMRRTGQTGQSKYDRTPRKRFTSP
jgi:hypothetical protein